MAEILRAYKAVYTPFSLYSKNTFNKLGGVV